MLDNRKLVILTEIIDYHIKYAEPIGSRTLSKVDSIGLSSATIRNEMSDLEELGYLTKTHVSSGRVPSEKAYRLYVNRFLDDALSENLNIKNYLVDSLENESKNELYTLANKMLSEKTNYITVLISPVLTSFKIDYLVVERLDSENILVVFIEKHGYSKNYVVGISNIRGIVDVREIEKKAREFLVNKDFHEIKKIFDNLPSDYPNRVIILKIMELGMDFLRDKNFSIYLDGVSNAYGYFDNENEFKSLMNFLEDYNNLFNYAMKSDDKLNIKIGSENSETPLKFYSTISSRYRDSNDNYGNVLLIGPTRMDYKKILNIIYNFTETLSSIENKNEYEVDL